MPMVRVTGISTNAHTALATPLLRAHPDSLPPPDDYPLEEVLLIWDEPSANFRIKNTVSVTFDDFQQTLASLLGHQELFAKLQPLFFCITPIDGWLPRAWVNTA